MLVYKGIKSSFIDDVDLGIIADKIRNKYIEVIKRRPSTSEFNSWKNSMQYMRGVLSDSEISNNAGIAIEYNIPPTGCRVDFMMSGYNKNTANILIIELKQWDKVTEVGQMDGVYKVNTYTGGGLRDVNHPSYQAMTYAKIIKDYNEFVQLNDINIAACAYLHNYYFDDDTLLSNTYKEYIEEAPLFGHNDVIKLRNFIKMYIETGDDANLLSDINQGKIGPSKMLQDSLKEMLNGKKEFYMIDDQKIVYEYAIKNATDTIFKNEKNVMIVRGSPGTGKSVLAINLLVELNNKNMTCFYVTKNSAPRGVYSSKLRGEYTQTYINHLFQGSGNFIYKERNSLDCLIVDEAHRLNEKSGLFQNKGENQIKEIINSAKFSIFFIDENQKVTLKDIGSEDLIRKFAKELGASVSAFDLDSQFRCNGSDGYLAWLDRLLEIRNTANFDIDDFNYEFKVLDNPNELRRIIEAKNSVNNKSRIVAGYCWNWISEGRNKSDIHDIVIPKFDFEMSWNLGNSQTWAIDSMSVNEAGCIHTCQGLEFDYVGVIIGDDLRYENGHIITDYNKRAKSDNSLKGINKIVREQGQEVANKLADSIIKNTYRTLMTRGMKGCYVYCTNSELANYLKKQ